MRRKIIFYCVFSLLVMGCANWSFIRPDIFSDTKSVSAIYAMPILESVGIDQAYLRNNKKKQHILSKMTKAIFLIKEEVKNNLEEKGYKLNISEKNFSDLNPDQESERIQREAIHLAADFVKFTNQAIGTITVTPVDQKSESKTINLSDVFNEDKKDESLINKSIEYISTQSDKPDTIMYINVKSFIAKRFLGLGMRSDSYVTFKIVFVSIKRKEIIFSFKRTYERTDLLTTHKMLKGLDEILNNIPVRLF